MRGWMAQGTRARDGAVLLVVVTSLIFTIASALFTVSEPLTSRALLTDHLDDRYEAAIEAEVLDGRVGIRIDDDLVAIRSLRVRDAIAEGIDVTASRLAKERADQLYVDGTPPLPDGAGPTRVFLGRLTAPEHENAGARRRAAVLVLLAAVVVAVALDRARGAGLLISAGFGLFLSWLMLRLGSALLVVGLDRAASGGVADGALVQEVLARPMTTLLAGSVLAAGAAVAEQRLRPSFASAPSGRAPLTAHALAAGSAVHDRATAPPQPAAARSRPINTEVRATPERLSGVRRTIEAVVTIGVTVAVTVFIGAFLARPYLIPTSSMAPALEPGDRILSESVTYRFGSPARGHVVTFRPPDGAATDVATLVKRVIGLPGERIELRGGVLLVDGTRVEEPWLVDDPPRQDHGPLTVPLDAVFVLGDNRANSEDSRFFGTVPIDHIGGRVVVRVWPTSRLGGI